MFSLDRIKYLLVLVMIAALPFSESIKAISLYAAFFVMLVQLYRGEIKLRMTMMHWGFILMILAALACSIFAEDQAKSLRGIRDILCYSTVFFVACSTANEKYARNILWTFYISAALAAIVGVVYLIRSGDLIEIHNLRNSNYIAMYMVITLTSMVASLIFSNVETRGSRILLSMLILLVLAAAILTVFRSSFIGFILFAVALVFARGRARRLLPYAVGLLAVFFLAAFLYPPMWHKLLFTKSFFARLALWQHAIDLLMGSPVVGVGLNHYKGLIPVGVPDAGRTFYDAHSLYLNVAAQMGLLGLSSLAVIVFGFMREFVKTEELSGFGMSLKYGALGGFLVTFAGGLFDTTLHHGHAVAFALLMGLFVAHVKRTASKEQISTEKK